MLGLADQVGRDERGVGTVVGEHGDLGRTGLGVDPDEALDQALRGDGVDVAGSGDEVDRTARPGAVGEHRDGLGTADGVHLGDAEEGAGGEDRRVRQAPVVGRGDEVSASDRTPATWAGTTFMTTLDTSGAMPPGT